LELASRARFIAGREHEAQGLIKIDNDFENINKNSFDHNFEDIETEKSHLIANK